MRNQNEAVLVPITNLGGVNESAAATLSQVLNIQTVAHLARSRPFDFVAELADAVEVLQ